MPLLSRALDPVLGVFTGALAYYMYEKNPRTAPAKEDTLSELIRWKREKWRKEQAERDATAEAEFRSSQGSP